MTPSKPKPIREIKVWAFVNEHGVISDIRLPTKRWPASQLRALKYHRATLLLPSRKGKAK